MEIHPFDILIHPAIELAINDLKSKDGPNEKDYEDSHINPVYENFNDLSQQLGEKGDILLWGSKRKKDKEVIIKMFTDLAKAIAVMSFIPGGLDFMGKHYETKLENISSEGMDSG